jgi:hypothetical protein
MDGYASNARLVGTRAVPLQDRAQATMRLLLMCLVLPAGAFLANPVHRDAPVQASFQAATPTPAARIYLPLVVRSCGGHVADVSFEFSQVVSTPDDPRARAVAFHEVQLW